jgi:hypothetical protein
MVQVKRKSWREDHSEDLGVEGKDDMDLREKGLEGVDWVHLAQSRDQWQALVNM